MKKSQEKMFPWIQRTRIRKNEHNPVTQKWGKKIKQASDSPWQRQLHTKRQKRYT